MVYPKIVQLCKSEKAPLDKTFYFLSLNHIGLLNYVTIRNQEDKIKFACFNEMRNQLLSIQSFRPKRMPKMFKLLEKAILTGNYEAWEKVAQTINEYRLLKKWREIN